MIVRFAILSGCLDNYLPLAKTTLYRNKADYCKQHGYDLVLCRALNRAYSNPRSHASGFSWSRLAMMLQLVESGKYEWVYCVGCDTMITNFRTKLEDLVEYAWIPKATLPELVFTLPPGVPAVVIDHWPDPLYQPDGRTHVIFSCDRASVVQADSFFVRGSTQGAEYLKDILAQYRTYETLPWVEQQAMADLKDKHAAITRIVPQWVMNSYDYPLYRRIGPYYDRGLDCYGNRGQWKKGDFLIHWPATPLSLRLELARKYEKEVIHESSRAVSQNRPAHRDVRHLHPVRGWAQAFLRQVPRVQARHTA